jgi:hypothetical protein
LYLTPGAASKRRTTSSGLNTIDALRGSRTKVRRWTKSARSSVTLKKNRRATIAQLMLVGLTRFLVICN